MISMLVAYLIIGTVFWVGLLLQGDHTDSRLLLVGAGAFIVALWPICMPSIIQLTEKYYSPKKESFRF